jgi:hypothetical protein
MEVFLLTTDKKQFTLRLKEEIHDKIKFIADANRRSLTMQIEFLIEQHIKEFEKEHGEIK